ncbi:MULTISPECIES: hypothetical protein [Microbulbifer]|nr:MULTISPECIES: hypothetical protein [Microbulbifer]
MRKGMILIVLLLLAAGCSRQVCDERRAPTHSPGPIFPHAGIMH